MPGYQTHPLSHSPSPGRTREKNVMENHVSQDKHRERSPQWDRRAWTAAAHREVNGVPLQLVELSSSTSV